MHASSGDENRRSVGSPPGQQDRAAVVAGLAAAIARVGPGGTAAAGGTPRPRPSRTGADRHAAQPVSQAHDDGRLIPPEDPAGPAGDDPGDPEAVAKAICLRQLTVRARSRSELDAVLRRREIPPDVAMKVLDRFTEVGLIDDAGYAQAFVASKHRGRGLGRAALRTELRKKGINGPVADRALAQVDSDSERRRAADLVGKRLDSAMFAGLPAARRRLLGLLARRGYPASLATQVVNEALRGYVEAEAEPDDETAPDWEGGSP